MPDTHQPEQPGKLLEEIDPNSSATPQELGVTGSASGHDVSVDFDSAIDENMRKLPPKESGGEGEEKDEPEKPEEPVAGGEEAASSDDQPETPAKVEAGEPVKEEEKKVEPRPEDKTASDRDSDLKALSSKFDPHTKPKTKKLFEAAAAETIKARDRADAVERALKEKEARLAELEKRVASTELPKEVNEELTKLRDTVRELDITRDPQIVAKYDSKIEANTNLVLDTLKKAGLPESSISALKKSGISLSNVKAYIDMLETGKGADGKQYAQDPETAEALRESIRENGRLEKAKEQEISEWKSNWDVRQKDQKANQEKAYAEATERQTKEFGVHVAKFDFLKPPPEPLDSDTPAIKKEKEKARVEFNNKVAQFGETVKKETADPLSQLITSKIGIMYRDLVVPELQAKNSKLEARVKELEGQVGKFRTAGSISKTVSASPGANKPKVFEPEDDDPDDPFGSAIDSLAKQAGSAKE